MRSRTVSRWNRRSCAATMASRGSTVGTPNYGQADFNPFWRCRPGCTVRRCSHAARRKRSWLRRWARRVTSRSSTRCRPRSFFHASLQHATLRDWRDGPCGGRRSVVKSATGALQKRALLAVLPSPEESPTRCVVSIHGIEWIGQWLRFAVAVWRDGCGCLPDEAHVACIAMGRSRATVLQCCPTSWVMKIILVTWTSSGRNRARCHPALQMDIKITGITKEIMHAASRRREKAGCISWRK